MSVPKATEFGEITRRLAITPFKVIQGHRFWYQYIYLYSPWWQHRHIKKIHANSL